MFYFGTVYPVNRSCFDYFYACGILLNLTLNGNSINHKLFSHEVSNTSSLLFFYFAAPPPPIGAFFRYQCNFHRYVKVFHSSKDSDRMILAYKSAICYATCYVMFCLQLYSSTNQAFFTHALGGWRIRFGKLF